MGRAETLPVMTPEMIADRWGCSARHVRNLLRAGELPGFRLGGKLWRVRREAVEEFEGCNIGSDGTGESSASSGMTEANVIDVRSARTTARRPSAD